MYKRNQPKYSSAIANLYSEIGQQRQNTIYQIMESVNEIRIPEWTSENILDIAKRMYEGRKVLVYSGADDATWLPAQNADFVYGLFDIISCGTQIFVTATRYDGKLKASITYANGHWYDWKFEHRAIHGQQSVSVPSNGTSVLNIDIENPGNRPFSVSAMPLNTSWAIVTMGSIGDRGLQLNVRNLNTSQQIECIINYSIIFT